MRFNGRIIRGQRFLGNQTGGRVFYRDVVDPKFLGNPVYSPPEVHRSDMKQGYEHREVDWSRDKMGTKKY